MLYIVGLGLGDCKDITVKGLEAVRNADRIYLESYTSILSISKEKLEEFYEKSIIAADREMVEQADEILEEAKENKVALLVVGDPFGATTHSDFVLRAHQAKVKVEVIHNTSIMNAVGCCGLQLYSFGETVSIVFWTDTWKPESFYDKILRNRKSGHHTLCLLDIKVKEKSIENLIKGRDIYEPPQYMSVNVAAQQLIQIIENRLESGVAVEDLAYTKSTLCVGLARIGWSDQMIKVGTLEEMSCADLGPPLHSFIITGGTLHPLELDMLKINAIDENSFDVATKQWR